jgi:hypothetical protein
MIRIDAIREHPGEEPPIPEGGCGNRFLLNRRQKKPKVGRRSRRWCWLTADSELELHAFAGLINLPHFWFRGLPIPHYVVTHHKRWDALRAGAVPQDSQTTESS